MQGCKWNGGGTLWTTILCYIVYIQYIFSYVTYDSHTLAWG